MAARTKWTTHSDRADVGRDALFETDALLQLCIRIALDLVADDSVYEDKLVLRGLLMRLAQLNSSVMSILCDDHAVTTSVLRERLNGDVH